MAYKLPDHVRIRNDDCGTHVDVDLDHEIGSNDEAKKWPTASGLKVASDLPIILGALVLFSNKGLRTLSRRISLIIQAFVSQTQRRANVKVNGRLGSRRRVGSGMDLIRAVHGVFGRGLTWQRVYFGADHR